MKKLLINSAFFLILLNAALVIYYFSTNAIIKANTDFGISKNIKYGVFGHSHPETAFNDSIISELKNFANSGESYFYTFQKIKSILSHNQHIRAVFVEFTNNQIGSKMDDWTWDEMHLDNKYLNSNSFIDLKDQSILLKNNPSKFLKTFFLANKRNTNRILEGNFDFSDKIKFGGFNKIDKSKIDSLARDLDVVAYREFKEDYEISDINLIYLRKIINYCQERNVDVFLIRSPLHEFYQGFSNEKNFQSILNTHFSDIKFIDMSEFPLDDYEFVDLEHLNFYGANKFSGWFNELLKRRDILKGDSADSLVLLKLDSLKKQVAYKLISNLTEILNSEYNSQVVNILKSGNFEKFDCEFLPGISSNAIYLSSDSNSRYLLLHLLKSEDIQNLKDYSFGVHVGIYEKDLDKRPKWLKERNSDRITFKGEPDIIELYDEKFLFLKLDRKADIDEFEYLRIFLQDRDKYRGVIGNAKRIDHIKFN